MTRFQDQVTDEHLHPVPNVEIFVFHADGSGQAAALLDDSAAALAQPLHTDANGIFYYNTDDGLYENHVYYGGELRYIQQAQLGPLPAGPPGLANNAFATRTAMAAYAPAAGLQNGDHFVLSERGREGSFVVDAAASWTAQIAADTMQGLFVASGTDATKVYRRVFFGDASAAWFGFKDDDAGGAGTDNGAAIDAAVAALSAFKKSPLPYGYGNGGSPGLQIVGFGYVGHKITVSHAVRIYGIGNGVPGGAATQLRWPDGVGGFLFAKDTASGWELSRMRLIGGWNNGDENESHAVEWHSKGTRRDLFISNWGGEGFYNKNDVIVGNGNTNGDLSERCFIQACRRGTHSEGGDVNGTEHRGIVSNSNRQWGISECGFLGAVYPAFLLEGNARLAWNTGAPNRPCSYVSQGGYQYACVNGQEAWCSTHPPTGAQTSNQGWAYWQPGGPGPGCPAWASGINVRAGGGILHSGLSNFSKFNGYIEGDECSQLDQYGLCDWISGASASNFFLVVGGVLNAYGMRPLGLRANTGGGAMMLPHSLNVRGNLVVQPQTNGLLQFDFTTTGAASDLLLNFNQSNFYNTLNFQHNGANYAVINASSSQGIFYNAISPGQHCFQCNNAVIEYILANTVCPGTDNTITLGTGTNRWSQLYAGTATINTSDEREKRDIASPADKLLDAWGEVDWISYRDRRAVKAKGKAARVHHGLIAQRVRDVFKGHKLDGFALGLLCFDQWEDVLEEETEDVEIPYTEHQPNPAFKSFRLTPDEQPTIAVERPITVRKAKLGKDGKPAMRVRTKAGDRYGIRYAEALALEAAYQRRRADRIEARLAKLERARR